MKKEIEKEKQRVLKKAILETDDLKKKIHVNEAEAFFIHKFKEYIHV